MSLKTLFEKQNKRAEVVKLLADLETSDPDFYREIREQIALNGNGSANSATNGTHGRTDAEANFQRVAALWDDDPDAWIDTKDLQERSGLSKHQLQYVLRQSHASRFNAPRPHPEHGKKLQWKLKHPNE